ncbi:hypothetical protein ACN38_g1721 [Penicillium nordicum]|uniref:Uncharacterized protein n=1 Tax=Penicillium nordicum TaxID=229535 RepID=A0A0M8P8F8_9EURO|nr:hypothetical protein ACN38_g1721 [Penicillium nordicum]
MNIGASRDPSKTLLPPVEGLGQRDEPEHWTFLPFDRIENTDQMAKAPQRAGHKQSVLDGFFPQVKPL